MNPAFADTVHLIALINERDRFHQRAVALAAQHRKIVTSDWILMEVADGLAGSHCRGRLRDYLLSLKRSRHCEIVGANDELLVQALELYHRHADKRWSLTDCTSFILMRQRGLTDALMTDHHFEQAGFNTLLK